MRRPELPLPRPHPGAAPDGAAAPSAIERRGGAHRWLRWTFHGALAALAALMALAALQGWHSETQRASDGDAIYVASAQRRHSEHLARMAALAGPGPGVDSAAAESQTRHAARADLASMLVHTQGEAQSLVTLLASEETEAPSSALSRAGQAWEQSRRRLYAASFALLELTTTAAAASPATLMRAVTRVQIEADATEQAAHDLAEALQARAVQHGTDALQNLGRWGGAAGLLLVLLALGVVEPTVRAVRRQHGRLAAQARQLERFALMAQRTVNAVVVSDLDGRITWVNDGFTRISGYCAQDVLGRRPGEFLRFEPADPAAGGALDEAVAARRAAQVRILNRGKDGRAYWVQVDLQPVRDDAGTVSGFMAVQTDITEQVQARQRLDALLEALPAGVIVHAADGRVTDANPAAQRILGLAPAELCGLSPTDAGWRRVREDGSHLPAAEHPALRAIATGQAQRSVLLGVDPPGGARRWLRINTTPLHGTDGAVNGAVSSFIDVTEASAQRRLLELTVDAAGLGTWDWNLQTSAVDFNERWWQMLGYQAGELPATAQSWEQLMHPEDLPLARAALERHFADPAQPYRNEFRMHTRDGDWAWVMAAGAVIERDDSGAPRRMAGVHLDIGERKRLEQALSDAALTDALTGLPNRAALSQRLAHSLQRVRQATGQCLGLLFLDLDRFKQVNDSLGHDAGDELLRQIAQRLRHALRSGDDVARLGNQSTAARLGGDEFVVLVEPLHAPADALAVAQRLLRTLAAPYTLGNRELHCTVSIGVVTSADPEVDADMLLRNADTAMYEAKRSGRGRAVLFSADMFERVQRSVELESDLRVALATPGQLQVAYQPIVELATRQVVGVEALARWQHPRRGEITPVEFIPLAEDCGLIGELGEWILRQACHDLAAWRATLGARAPATVSVNLSRAQMHRERLPALVAAVLAETGLPATALRLEVTESMAMLDAAVADTLAALRALGVSLALDDFGTGYSSLASLDRLPLDVVKIDRSFVQRMATSRYQTALVEASLRVAKSLGLAVVAEGVEDELQAGTLQALGCPLAQGWLFGRALPSEQLVQQLLAPQQPGREPARPARQLDAA